MSCSLRDGGLFIRGYVLRLLRNNHPTQAEGSLPTFHTLPHWRKEIENPFLAFVPIHPQHCTGVSIDMPVLTTVSKLSLRPVALDVISLNRIIACITPLPYFSSTPATPSHPLLFIPDFCGRFHPRSSFPRSLSALSGGTDYSKLPQHRPHITPSAGNTQRLRSRHNSS